MGGSLYLQNGYAPNRANVCVSGYDSQKENAALSNFDSNAGQGYHFMDPNMGHVWFPTAEHYLHFQKLNPAGKSANYLAWQQANPSTLLRGLRDVDSPYFIRPEHNAYMDWQQGISQPVFKGELWDQHKMYVQMQINATKYQQSPNFQQSIHQAIAIGRAFRDGAGPATIIEDTSTAAVPEALWGTGADGHGQNILGNSQTAFARLLEQGKIPQTTALPTADYFCSEAVTTEYGHAMRQYQAGVQQSLQQVRRHYQGQIIDTSDLPPQFVQRIAVQDNTIVAVSSVVPSHQGQMSRGAAPSLALHAQQSFAGYFPATSTTSATYYNANNTKRLVFNQNDQVIGRQFLNDRGAWEDGTNPAKFADLERVYYQHRQQFSPGGFAVPSAVVSSSASGVTYYTSRGGNQRLLIQSGQVVGHEFCDSAGRWQQGGDRSRFSGLETAYYQSRQPQVQSQFGDLRSRVSALRLSGDSPAAGGDDDQNPDYFGPPSTRL